MRSQPSRKSEITRLAQSINKNEIKDCDINTSKDDSVYSEQLLKEGLFTVFCKVLPGVGEIGIAEREESGSTPEDNFSRTICYHLYTASDSGVHLPLKDTIHPGIHNIDNAKRINITATDTKGVYLIEAWDSFDSSLGSTWIDFMGNTYR